MSKKLPAFQFYIGDWRKDPGVQALSYHDRGVWFEILCLMHESDERGKLLLNGRAMTDAALSQILGLDLDNQNSTSSLTKTLTTLIDYGVASRDEATGALMSRRMVRDEDLRRTRTECGKLGGNPNLKKNLDNQNQTKRLKQKTTPSVSSSINTTDAAASAGRDEQKNLSVSDTGDHKRLMATLQERIGPISDGGAQGKAIKWLLSKGYKPEQCVACLDALRSEGWRTGRISWTTVQKEIGSWLNKKAVITTHKEGLVY